VRIGALPIDRNATPKRWQARLSSLAAGKVHTTVKFSGGTAKNAKSSKKIV
jgi:hypothetical protein